MEVVSVVVGILILAGLAMLLHALGLPPIAFVIVLILAVVAFGLLLLWIEVSVLGSRGETRDDVRTAENQANQLAREIEKNGPVIPPMGLARYNQTLYPNPPVPQEAAPAPESKSKEQPGAH